ncbi:MAG: hypothetical protein IJX75_01255 [Clostridia bacterium]|nr:hypothetical protein [Clostridia bacterium]
MEPFALFQILKSLLPIQADPPHPQEEKNSVSTENVSSSETEKSTDLEREQRDYSSDFKQNAFLQFAAAHDARAKRTKK